MDSLGTGFRPDPAGHYYQLQNVVDPDLPFTISLTARVLQEESSPHLPYNETSFGFAVFTGTYGIGIYIGYDRIVSIEIDGGRVLSNLVDTSLIHNYRLEVEPVTGYEFFVDDISIGSGPWADYQGIPNCIDFGDRTKDAGGKSN